MYRTVLTCVLWILCSSFASGSMVFNATGVAGTGENLDFSSTFTISGNNLTIVLTNNSTDPVLNPDAVLASMYFDIVNAGNRPTLTYGSATGAVYLTDKNNPDSLQNANANLKAVANGDDTWQFKTFNPAVAPLAGFGVGTVGNGLLTPNNFNGNITGGINYGIVASDITTSNLNNRLLVRDSIQFSFTGVSGFSESDLRNVTFGLGTGPDSLLHSVPEPTSVSLFACASVWFLKRRRKTNR